MRDPVGDLAIVLHTHMPYVEGFGTYPFGEEWLFDAFARSHLPVLEVAHDLTMSVTPVLADQLEAPGVAERMQAFLRRHRLEAAERDGSEAEAALYRAAVDRLDSMGGDPLGAFRAATERNVALIPSAATHAVLPLLASEGGRRLQIDAALRSHTRRFGESSGFWLPECAYAPGLETTLSERGIRFFCTDQSRHERALEALAPIEALEHMVAFPIHWPTIQLVWSEGGYPSASEYLEYHRQSINGIRLWAIGGERYDPEAARARVRADADHFCQKVAELLSEFARERGRPGLLTFAVDTELLGEWWTEGPTWLAAVLDEASGHGIRLTTLAQAHGVHEPEQRPLRPSSWGEGKDLRTWDGPRVADLAWAARRLELRLSRAVAARAIEAATSTRAARELLALQSSDWAFLDATGKAGEYPYERAIGHAGSLLEALDSAAPPDPQMRNLAPDISVASLLEP